MYTPWGTSQTQHRQAEGLTWVSTASHGGLRLSPERQAQLAESFPFFKSWTGTLEWLEEDCDCQWAILCWPDDFTPQDVYFAVRYFYTHGDLPSYTWDRPSARKAQAISLAFEYTITDKWERGSLFTSGASDGWHVFLTRNGERIIRLFDNYPMQAFYTDAELDTVSSPEPA